MNTDAAAARALVEGIKASGASEAKGVEKVLCPPFVYLPVVSEVAQGTALQVGAQDLHWEEKGAFTGEISATMLKDFATHVIIGHSERRQFFGETDESVNKKLAAALGAGLTPIVCVGETGTERNAGQMEEVLTRQVKGALSDITLPEGAVIAYEPVWAIGTGVAATADDANAAIAFIRAQVAALQGDATAQAIRILYGGSVTAANIAELVAQPEIDGGLVGGASLVAESFAQMVQAIAS
jgi:triosephosphate isomerase